MSTGCGVRLPVRPLWGRVTGANHLGSLGSVLSSVQWLLLRVVMTLNVLRR